MNLKSRIKAHPLYWKIKLFLKRVAGRELWVRAEVKLETVLLDGWCFSAKHLNADSVVYSFGVGDSIGFDLGLIEMRHSTVHAFDPTPTATGWLDGQDIPANFIFHPWAVSGGDGVLRMARRVNRKGRKSRTMWTAITEQTDDSGVIEVPSLSLSSIMQKLGHNNVDLLKMDVEGSEYEVIETLVAMSCRPPQLLVEFHHRFPGIGPERTVKAISSLRSVGYKVFSVSETGREISFIHESCL